MPSSKSPLAHDYLRDIFDRALQEEHGLKITCKNHGEAMDLRGKLNYFRYRDRAANAKTYPDDHPLYRASAWDRLTLSVGKADTPNAAILTIKPTPLDHLIIESITKGPLDD